jgi:hypothetical protein
VGAVAALAVGVLVAVLASRVATAALPGAFRAQAAVALVADDRVVPAADHAGPGWDERMANYARSEASARTASELLVDPVLVAEVGGSAAVSAAPGLVTITVTAASAAEAERIAQTMLDRRMLAAEPLIGQVRLVPRDPPAGSAVPTGLPAGMLLAASAPVGFLLGVLLVLGIRSAAMHLRGRRAGTSLQ